MKSNVVSMCCTRQDKVQQVQKGAENVFHVRLSQSRDLCQQRINQEIENRRYHNNHKDQNFKVG